MKKKHILFFLFCFVLTGISAQTLEQAKVMFNKKQYSEAKPVFKKYVKSQPANGNYNLWSVSYTHLTLPTKRIV